MDGSNRVDNLPDSGGFVQLPFALQEQISAVSSLFKRYENVLPFLADAPLIRLAEINDSPFPLTPDGFFIVIAVMEGKQFR